MATLRHVYLGQPTPPIALRIPVLGLFSDFVTVPECAANPIRTSIFTAFVIFH